MSDTGQTQKRDTTREVEETQATTATKTEREDLIEDVDELIDEIDEVLEENAEEFIKNYVQKGGE